jgi:hypothetical protein
LFNYITGKRGAIITAVKVADSPVMEAIGSASGAVVSRLIIPCDAIGSDFCADGNSKAREGGFRVGTITVTDCGL